MSIAADLLDRLAEVGAKVEAAGNRLIVRAGPKPVPGELVQRLREAKADVLAALAPAAGRTPAEAAAFDPSDSREAAWWRRHFIIRTIDLKLGVPRSDAEAAWLVWGELQDRWNRLHGERVAQDLCCGCRRPIGDGQTLDLCDGNRVHFDDLDCLLQHGRRWRGAATRALTAMGLQPPTGTRSADTT
jgi:hypothetical protein